MRFLLYSHDGLGLGHTRRNLAVARALTDLDRGASVLLACGVDEVAHLGLPPRVEVLKVPSLRKADNGHYVGRRLQLPAEEIHALRAALFLAAVRSFRPSAVLVDKHPLGAGGEFRDALRAVRRAGGGAVLGLRDILDDRETVRQEWSAHGLIGQIQQWYDEVLVYGHRSVYDPTEEYGFPPTLAQRTRFCGYVINHETSGGHSEADRLLQELAGCARPAVVATAGGGEDGFSLLETFIQACRGAPWQGIVVAGPMIPDHDLKSLACQAARAQVVFHTLVPSLPAVFWSVDALVSMGGYNTLAEAAAKALPTVAVPRVAPRQEQWLRAKALERLGLLATLHSEELSVETLREKIHAALRVPRQELLDRANRSLDFRGARLAAGYLLALASRRRPEAAKPLEVLAR